MSINLYQTVHVGRFEWPHAMWAVKRLHNFAKHCWSIRTNFFKVLGSSRHNSCSSELCAPCTALLWTQRLVHICLCTLFLFFISLTAVANKINTATVMISSSSFVMFRKKNPKTCGNYGNDVLNHIRFAIACGHYRCKVRKT